MGESVAAIATKVGATAKSIGTSVSDYGERTLDQAKVSYGKSVDNARKNIEQAWENTKHPILATKRKINETLSQSDDDTLNNTANKKNSIVKKAYNDNLERDIRMREQFFADNGYNPGDYL